jgi:hypothetical protein
MIIVSQRYPPNCWAKIKLAVMMARSSGSNQRTWNGCVRYWGNLRIKYVSVHGYKMVRGAFAPLLWLDDHPE